MDPKRTKIQISWIQTNPTPSRRARHVNFENILFFRNGLRMAKLSRYEIFPKQEKNVKVNSKQSILLTLAM
jgi:hypothetical protein